VLKIERRPSMRYKCPRHPRQQYESEGALPASCSTCHAIWRVKAALLTLDAAERVAFRYAVAPYRVGLAKSGEDGR
jgi:hypothetical protein